VLANALLSGDSGTGLDRAILLTDPGITLIHRSIACALGRIGGRDTPVVPEWQHPRRGASVEG